MEKEYYVYRHIRLDTNEVFYVGVGTKPKTYKSHENEYNRAYDKEGRNSFWKKIAAKTDIKIEIIFESNIYYEVDNKEIEFIKLYGRRNLELGTLVNLTDGGKAAGNRYVSKEHKKNISKSRIGRFTGNDSPLSVEVYIYDIAGNFIKRSIGIRGAELEFGWRRGVIYDVLLGKALQYKGYRFYKTYQGEKIEPLLVFGNMLREKKVCQIDSNTGEVLFIFDSIKKAGKHFNVTASCISLACSGVKTRIAGYNWKYETDIK